MWREEMHGAESWTIGKADKDRLHALNMWLKIEKVWWI
jgi:hypothetical protein